MTITMQKASLWKRVSAWVFDLILSITIAIGVAFVVSSIVKYDDYNAKMQAKYEQYEVAMQLEYDQLAESGNYDKDYKIDITISDEELEKLPQEVRAIYEEAEEAFSEDPEVHDIQARIFELSILILSVSAFSASFIWQFIIPLLFKNGQTLGKKCFSIAVMRTNSVKVSNSVLFVRSILGGYAIETMVPLLMILMLYFGILGSMALIIIGLILILQVVVMIMSKTNSTIHDLLSDTVVIDMSTQKIFESEDALLAYKEMSAAIEAAHANGDEYRPVDLFGSATYRSEEENNDASPLKAPSIQEPTNEENNQDSEMEN
ncbi:MAG: RDD family protein [Clostridiales bacterium]|nr:RDD family protein [Clostridiales bacterium]